MGIDLAREQYLVNVSEEELQRPAPPPPMTPRQKWQNFWHYYRVHILVGAVTLLFVGFFIRDTLIKVHPDYEIGLMTSVYYSADATAALQARLEELGTDRNGDGAVVAEITSYLLPPMAAEPEETAGSEAAAALPDPAAAMTATTTMADTIKMQADFSVGRLTIYFTDDACFRDEQLRTGGIFSYLDGSTPAEGADDYENMRVPLADCPAFADLIADYPELGGLSVSTRIYYGSAAEKDKDFQQNWPANRELFELITAK